MGAGGGGSNGVGEGEGGEGGSALSQTSSMGAAVGMDAAGGGDIEAAELAGDHR